MLNDGDYGCLTRAVRLVDMMGYLSLVRKTTIGSLCARYNKGRSTIKSDLKALEYYLDVPFSNKQGLYIMVYEGWWFGRKGLTEKQRVALRYAIEQTEDEMIKRELISIL